MQSRFALCVREEAKHSPVESRGDSYDMDDVGDCITVRLEVISK
jgi:hypothetical protein